jgi:glycolate oxidase FAD binding subunit
VLASNASGPCRLCLGAPHDRILGAHFVLGDGTRARSGGKVVKNVAGFGIHRLLCGSHGGLAVILEASLKLLPAPERRLALIYAADPSRIADRGRWAAFPRLEPAALTVLGERAAAALPSAARVAAPFTVIAGFEDDASWVAQQEAATHAALGEPAVRLEADAAVELWQALADAEDRAGPRLTFTSPHHTPDALGPLAARTGAEALVFHAPAGRLHWFGAEDDVRDLLNECAGAGYTLIAARGIAGLEPQVAPQVAVLALRERIREALDPGRVLALGSVWQRGF